LTASTTTFHILDIEGTQTVISRHGLSVLGDEDEGSEGRVIWGLVERDPEPDINLVAGDADLFDHEPPQFLTLLEPELVQGTAHSAREADDLAAKPVLLREHAALLNQRSALYLKGVASGVDLVGATLAFGKLE
jgi:hypothetical protein